MACSSGSGRSTLTSWTHAGSGSRPPARWGRRAVSVSGHTYEVRVAGKLGRSAREAFTDIIIEVEPASTILSAQLDQEGLHALLDRVRALGLELVDIQQAPDPRSEERRVGKECRSRW